MVFELKFFQWFKNQHNSITRRTEMKTGYEKAVKNLLACEKRAQTLREKAKTFSEIGTANALKAHCRITRKTLEKLGVI